MTTIGKDTAARIIKASVDDERRVYNNGVMEKFELVSHLETLRELARNFADAFKTEPDAFLKDCGFDSEVGEVA